MTHLDMKFDDTVSRGMQHDALNLNSCPCQFLFSQDLKEFNEGAVTRLLYLVESSTH